MIDPEISLFESVTLHKMVQSNHDNAAPSIVQSVDFLGGENFNSPLILGASVTIHISFESAVIDSFLGFNYVLNIRNVYIGLKPKPMTKPLSGLVYPFITTYQDKSTIEFQG